MKGRIPRFANACGSANLLEREKTKLMRTLDFKGKPFIYRLHCLMGD
jgi:hypothetical protein